MNDEVTPTSPRVPSQHEIPTNGSGVAPDFGGPELASPEYLRYLVGKVGVMGHAIGRCEAKADAAENAAVRAATSARDAQTASESNGKAIQFLHVEINGHMLGFARAFEMQRQQIAPLVKARTEWRGAKAVLVRASTLVAASGLGALLLAVIEHWIVRH